MSEVQEEYRVTQPINQPPIQKSRRGREAAGTKIQKQIIALSLNPAVKTNKQIAEVIGVAPDTVSRVLRANRGTIEELNRKLDQYDSILTEGLSIRERAALYIRIATENVTEYPMACLKSLERMDDLQGIVTERDKMRVKVLPSEGPQLVPMFMLPAGSHVKVTRSEVMIPESSSGTVEVKALEEPQPEGDSNDATD